MHWADTVAEKLVERGSPVIETGTSISGIPHIGNASDVIRGDAVRRALADKGVEAELIWVSDDGDPFRKMPKGMEELSEHLGKPVYDVDKDNPQGSFVERYKNKFIEELGDFGVTPDVKSGTELYRCGELSDEIKTAFDNREKIVGILNRFRENKLPADYVPWTPVCAGCGKISTTRVTGVDGYNVSYVCEDIEVSGGAVAGCGFEGVSDALKGEGKLPWRVEWPARWHHFKVTCEPFGKDHAAAGGSYDTCKVISNEVFSWRAPEPVVYEFLTVGGTKISSSAGNVITLGDWNKIAEPEVLRYFMFKKLAKQRDIDLSKILNLSDEYDAAEKDYFAGNESEQKRMYDLAQLASPKEKKPKSCGVPYTLCAVLPQTSGVITPGLYRKEGYAEESTAAMARSSGAITPGSYPDIPVGLYQSYQKKVEDIGYKPDPNRLKERIVKAWNWIHKFGPDYLRFELSSEEEFNRVKGSLSEKQKEGLRTIARLLDEKHSAAELHKKIYETARGCGISPPELFKATYLVLIGKEKGPKAAMFLLTLDRDFVQKRFRST